MLRPFLFIALLPDADSRAHLDDRKKQLSVQYQAVKALSASSHITLYPPIHVQEDALPDIDEMLKKIASEYPSILLKTNGIDCFGERTVFVDVPEHPLLVSMSNQIRQQMAELGFPALNRPFKPHFTLLNRDVPAQACQELRQTLHTYYRQFECTIESIALFERNASNTAWNIVKNHPFLL